MSRLTSTAPLPSVRPSRSPRRRAVALGVAIAALAAPAPAAAATLGVHDGVLHYVGSAGGESRVNIEQTGTAEVRFNRGSNYGDTDPVALGTGCTPAVNPDEYLCSGVSRLRVELGDGVDGVGVYNVATIPAELEGGPGDDYLSGGHASDVLRGGAGADYLYAADGGNDVDGGDGDDEIFSDTGTDILRGGGGFDSVEFSRTENPAPHFSITLDGLPNDGVAGENDLVAADIEDVKAGTADYAGAPGSVSVLGDAGTNVLRIDYGTGVMAGRDGNDLLTGGPHDDVIDGRDGYADRVSCGDGADQALLDAFDTVASDCESVERLPEPTAAVDDAPPAISLSAPRTGSILAVGDEHPLAAQATDDRGVAKVQFVLGEQLLCEDVSAPFTCAFTPAAADVGRQTLVAVAIDTREQTAVALRALEIRDAAPPAAPVQVSVPSLAVSQDARTVGIPIACGAQGGNTCAGTLSVDTLIPRAGRSDGARAARRGRRVTIARARFSTAAGARSVVKARVSRRGVRTVLRGSGAQVRRRTVTARITVKLDGSRQLTRWKTRLTIGAKARR